MIAILTFSIIAAALVLLAGRKDIARDPRLTLLLLILLAILPTMAALMPKIELLPASSPTLGHDAFPWTTIAIWAAGIVYHLGRLYLAGIFIAKWRKGSAYIDTIGKVSVRALTGLRSPVAAGVIRKTVFVPSGWGDLPEEHRKIALAHELTHHRRHDPLWRLCVELVRAVHWWNPLVHWMARRYIMQSECACDESVIRQGTDAKAYANVLCDFAENHPPNSFALAMAETSSLQKRVGRILAKKNKSGVLLLAFFAMLGISAACALSMLEREPSVSPAEVKLRLTANPFPGER
ncbi:MAG: M56 family metallopeptidase [Luteolibacter sp.]